MTYPNAGYVYAIRNVKNGGMYIGSTTKPNARWITHRSSLRRGVHHSFILQRAWDKHGESAFEFKVLFVCPENQRLEYEACAMKLQRYNVLRTPRENLARGGWHHTEAFKARISAIHKGKKLSEEHRRKMSAAQIGRKYDTAFREKARARQLGVSPSDTTRARLSDAVRRARAPETLRNADLVRRAYHSILDGAELAAVLDALPFSRNTFYAYCKRLGLAPLRRKGRSQ